MHNLGVHITHNPAGTYSFVGTLPAALGDVVKADRAAIYGNRTLNQRGPENEIMMLKFPVFLTLAGAYGHAKDRGVTVISDTEKSRRASEFPVRSYPAMQS